MEEFTEQFCLQRFFFFFLQFSSNFQINVFSFFFSLKKQNNNLNQKKKRLISHWGSNPRPHEQESETQPLSYYGSLKQGSFQQTGLCLASRHSTLRLPNDKVKLYQDTLL